MRKPDWQTPWQELSRQILEKNALQIVNLDIYRDMHQQKVENAIREGLPVPKEIRDFYQKLNERDTP